MHFLSCYFILQRALEIIESTLLNDVLCLSLYLAPARARAVKSLISINVWRRVILDELTRQHAKARTSKPCLLSVALSWLIIFVC